MPPSSGGRSICRSAFATSIRCRAGAPRLAHGSPSTPPPASSCGPQRGQTCRGSSPTTRPAPALPAAASSRICSRAPRRWRASPSARDGRLAGYALGRDGHRAMHIGPVVAEDEAIGLALLGSAMACHRPSRVILDVPDQHGAIRQWLADQGATAPRALHAHAARALPGRRGCGQGLRPRRPGAGLRRTWDPCAALIGPTCRPRSWPSCAGAPCCRRIRWRSTRSASSTAARSGRCPLLHRCRRRRAGRRRARHAVPDPRRRPLPPGAGAGRRDRRQLDQAPAHHDRRRHRQDRAGRRGGAHGARARLPRRAAGPRRHARAPARTSSSPTAPPLPGRCRPIGFYLQTAVGGIPLSRAFWTRFAAIDNVIAIKVAPFNRYKTLDVAFGVVAAGAEERVTLYTGNDDHIVADLVTPLAHPHCRPRGDAALQGRPARPLERVGEVGRGAAGEDPRLRRPRRGARGHAGARQPW